MTVLVTLRITGDPAKLEAHAAEHQDELQALIGRAQEKGATHHTFYGSGREVLVVDEWPDEETFKRFYDDEQETIAPMVATADGGEPEVKFWHKLDTKDEF